MKSSSGFTLIEMMMTVVIIGVLAAVAIPAYMKARERTFWRSAQDLLLAIYGGERSYFLVNDAYHNVDEAAADPMAEWRKINIDNPNLPSIPVAYDVAASGIGTAAIFGATATRVGGFCGTWNRTINHNRVGTWSDTPPC